MRFRFIAKHRGIWPVEWMCEVLDASRSGFYEWLSRAPSARARMDEALRREVRRSFSESDETYGVRRIWRDLRSWGHPCGRERTRRLVRAEGLKARELRRRWPKDEGERLASAIAPNVLERDFQASAPNQRWVADFTYIWTLEGWLYVAAVLDLFSRKIVGWSMQKTMTAQLVADALMMAVWRRGKAKSLLHHSDQGSQYTSEQFQALLTELGIQCSMSRRGDCWDNAAMESFFSTLKIERVYRKQYATRDEARADVFDYIERFYNPRRRHSTLGYVSPAEFEQQAQSA